MDQAVSGVGTSMTAGEDTNGAVTFKQIACYRFLYPMDIWKLDFCGSDQVGGQHDLLIGWGEILFKHM
jgi:hypothetical protein